MNTLWQGIFANLKIEDELTIPKEILMSIDCSIHYFEPFTYSAVIVICFDEVEGGLKKKGFGVDFFEKQNIDCIFVSHASWSFFQGLTEENLAKLLAPYIKDKKVFTYGASLGGYAALYYADCLNAQAIAFSPRCSLDPIYSISKDYHAAFQHEILSSKTRIGEKSPVVIFDPFVEEDYLFFKRRVLSHFGDNLRPVELRNSSHHTARAMLADGVLQKFVMTLINENVVLDIDFKPLENPISLSHLALKAATSGQYDEANDFLTKLNFLEKEPADLMRIDAYLNIIGADMLNHSFDRKILFASEKTIVRERFDQQAKESKSDRERLLYEAEAEIYVFNFWGAVRIAEEIIDLYPDCNEAYELCERASIFFKNSKGLIL